VRTLVELAEKGKELIIAGCLAQHFQVGIARTCPSQSDRGTGDTSTSWRC